MSKEIPTPRTDAHFLAEREYWQPNRTFAESLERDLAEKDAEIARLTNILRGIACGLNQLGDDLKSLREDIASK